MSGTGFLILAGGFLYAVVSKSSNSLERSIKQISSAMKWKAYYKAVEKRENTDIPVPESPICPNDHTPIEGFKGTLKGAIQKAIDGTFGGVEAENGPLEGQIEAFKEDVTPVTDGLRNPIVGSIEGAVAFASNTHSTMAEDIKSSD